MYFKFVRTVIFKENPCIVRIISCLIYNRSVKMYTLNFLSKKFFFLFIAAPEAYGSSWARSRIGAASVTFATSTATVTPDPNPLSKAEDRTHILMGTEPQRELLISHPSYEIKPLEKMTWENHAFFFHLIF